MTHSPLKFAMGLSAKLAARSRHVCTFFGAGIAKACGLPEVVELQAKVLVGLGSKEKALFEKQLAGRNLEQALSRLRRIAALLSGDEKIDGLTANEAAALDAKVCQSIVKELDIASANLKPVNDFAAWVTRSDYHSPLEIFTVNYDLLLETALEEWQVPYFDGFIGTLRARFRTELVEPLPGSDCLPTFFARLWKLHGSLNWEWDEKHKIFRCGNAVSKSAAIYPSDTKYDESRRMPFVVLQDRFRRALHHPETLVIVSGYAFGDDHLNEILFDAATRRERSEIMVFCYSDIPDALAARAVVTPNIQVASGTEAIIGGVRGPWVTGEEIPDSLWADEKFTLRDFKNLAAYLAKSATKDEETPVLLKVAESTLVPIATATKASNA
jgi:SIR2-like protein